MPMPTVLSASDLSALSGVRLLDARPGEAGRAAYAAGHLRGAVHADLDRDLAGDATRPEVGGRHPLPDLATWSRTLGRWGIGPSIPVVIYDAQGGANAAARAWWMLRAVGHRDVAILDGGFEAAKRAGMESTVAIEPPAAVDAYPVPGAWIFPTATREDVAARRDDPAWAVIDVRAAERFQGRAEPFDPVAGHIPGAINVPLTRNLGPDGAFLPADELRALYQAVLGTRRPDHLVVHCGSGVTACHALAALDRAGLDGASLYVGSWSEWCRTDEPKLVGEEAAGLTITVNGDRRMVPTGTTVRGLIEILGLGAGPVAVERNAEVVTRASHATTPIVDGDVLEIVHFVGGG